MEEREKLIWFVGLFEGEGTFVRSNGISKGLSITSTDKDVLERVKDYFGGDIYQSNPKKQKPHWKQAYIWTIRGKNSINIANQMVPFLLSRRVERAKEWLLNFENRMVKIEEKRNILDKRDKEMLNLRLEGLTHQKIADKLGMDRSHISKRLKMELEALR